MQYPMQYLTNFVIFSKKEVKVVASINSPMQCMMKEICAQCLQKHINPTTKQESFVYSCNNQDQYADYVDFKFLNERLKQNNLQEKCTALWIDHCLHKQSLNRNTIKKL
ncbi:MAG: hypothetical protein ACTJLM_04480 [Ehrlichia sp.]